MQSPPPKHESSASGRGSARGSIVIYLVLALVVFGVLTMAGVTRFGAAVTSTLSPDCAAAARFMAESGMRYAAARLRACTDATSATAAATAMTSHGAYVVDSAKGQSFTLTVSYNSGTNVATITSVGTGCSGLAPATSTASSSNVNVPGAATVDPSTVSISFSSDFSGFTIASAGTSGAITKNTGSSTVSLGNNLSSVNAAIWFSGTNALCTNGACALGNGLCATYTLAFSPYSSTQGDGLAWVIMNANTNTASTFGGGGEYLGYGGVSDKGTQIYPPKLVMEFDITPNYKNRGQICNKLEQIANDDGTDSNPYDHLAFMFWGNQTLSCNAAYDDHSHGAGAGTTSEPYNSYDFDGARDGFDGYYSTTTSSWSLPTGVWLRASGSTKTFYVRYELDRSTTANAQGNYLYTQRAWISTTSSDIPKCTSTMSDPPTVERTVALTSAMHQKLATSYFGWTVGSGAYSELATLSNFLLTFKGTPSFTSPTVASGYVAAFNFDEGAGSTTYDSGSNAFTGTLTGAVMWAPDVRSPNSASLFFTNAGSDGYVRVPDASALRLTSAGTLAAWINLREAGTAAPAIYKNGAYVLQINSNRTISLILGGTTVATTSSSYSLADNATWYHVAATWNGTTAVIYLNGVAARTVSSTKAATSNGNALFIGGNGSTSVDGRMDDVYVYNTALTSTAIANLAAGTKKL